MEESNDKKAVALKYDGKAAPRVTATAEGALAEEIIRLALECEIPLFENKQLTELLTQIELGDEIPELLYECIAQIIVFAYKIQGKFPPGWEEKNK
jgi:flagellar biosynthesis protein